MEETNPDVHRLWLGIAVMILMLTGMGVVRLIVDRTLARDDPRRPFIGKVVLYGATALFVLASLLPMLFAVSCSAHYTKTGATDLEWERDSTECERGASSSFYQRCLELRGWRKQ